MNITDCRKSVIDNKYLIGKKVSHNGEIYTVIDVIIIPPVGFELFLIEYDKYKSSERAISKHISSKNLNVALYCKNTNKTKVLLLSEIEIV